jgi:hypothetical protein
MKVIETFLICDGTYAGEGCGTNYGIDFRGRTTAQQRKSAKSNGWSFSKGKDYCPYCTAKNKLK